MSDFHPTLQQQLERHLKRINVEDFNPLLEAIDKTYWEYTATGQKLKQAVELGNDELRIATTEFTTLLEAFPDQLVWIDKNGMILRVQGNIVDRSIIAGRYFWESNDHDVRLTKRKAFEKLWKQKIEIEYAIKTEEVLHVEARIYPVINGRMIAIVRDISERKHLEDTLREAKEAAERADRTKSEFLAVMSHELRTPMNAIIGLSEMLTQSRLDLAQSDLANTIFESSNVLLAIINDVLDYSKIESGELKTEEIDFDLHRLLSEISQIMQPLTGHKPIQLEFNIDPDVPRIIVSDPLRIRQIIMNLLNNAIKFTARGKISIDLENQSEDTEQSKLVVIVKDQGIGISANALKNLFKPFSQVDSSTTRRYGGTGLGLAISKKIVNAMGGEIICTSTEGKGSEFRFDLPLIEGRSENIEEEKNDSTMENIVLPGEFSILLVEDNPVNVKVARAILEKLGAQVKDAENGQLALDMIAQEQFDLILMDCSMPVMDGYEATGKIRALPAPANTIPIVALTANALEGDELKCLNAGMNDYVAKPLRMDQIQKILSKWLQTSSPSKPANS